MGLHLDKASSILVQIREMRNSSSSHRTLAIQKSGDENIFIYYMIKLLVAFETVPPRPSSEST